MEAGNEVRDKVLEEYFDPIGSQCFNFLLHFGTDQNVSVAPSIKLSDAESWNQM